jgi:HEAT repeat protein
MSAGVASVSLTSEQQQQIAGLRRLANAGAGGVAELVEMLDDPSWIVRREVVAALAAGGDAAVAPLIQVLSHRRDNEGRIAAAVDALAASTADIFQAVRDLAESGSPAVIADAAQVLGRRRKASYVPLLARLVSHSDDNVAVASIEALGRIGGAGGLEALVAAARSGNFFRVFPAIDVLGRSGDPRAVAPLAQLLADPTYTLEAARALGRTGEPAAVAPLTALLARSGESAVRVAASALAELQWRHTQRYGAAVGIDELMRGAGPAATAERRLAASLSAADDQEKMAIAFVLGTLGGEVAVLSLSTLLDAAPSVAAAAVTALKKLGKRSEIQIREALRGGDSTRRKALLPAVTSLTAVPELLECLADEDTDVRVLACDALARLGATGAVSAIFRLLGDSNTRVVQAAIGAIQSLGSPETTALVLSATESGNASVRRAAMRILAYFGHVDALPAFLRAISDDDARVREAALAGLALVGDARAHDGLVGAASSPESKTRSAAMRALGQCPTPNERIVATVLAGLTDEDAWVRYYSCQALGRLHVESTIGAIVALLDDPAGQVRVAAIEALSHFRTRAAVRALVQAAGADDLDVRRAALIGLGLLGLSEVLPTLQAAAESADAATRLVAVSAFARTGSPYTLTIMSKAARDIDDNVRTAALGFLAALPSPEATAVLLELLRDASDRAPIERLLSEPNEGRVTGILAGLASADDNVAPLLASALARLRTDESARALFDAMKIPASAARKAAAGALASLRSPEAWTALRSAAEGDPDSQVRSICSVLLAE